MGKGGLIIQFILNDSSQYFAVCIKSELSLTWVGYPTMFVSMETLVVEKQKTKGKVSVVADFDVVADAKRRISLRGTKSKFFHVSALSNGAYLLEPRVLVPPEAVSARTLKLLEKSVAGLKQGLASNPVDLAEFL